MMGSWKWIARYALVLVAAVLLGTLIGELTVFKQTMLGTPKLPATALARFLGYGGALAMFTLLGQRAAGQLRDAGTGAEHLGALIFPLTLLIVLSAGYDIVLTTLRPFLSATHKDVYNWVFVLGISACALWLVVRLYRHSEGLVELVNRVRPRVRRLGTKCDACGAALRDEAKFCAACGQAAAAANASASAATPG